MSKILTYQEVLQEQFGPYVEIKDTGIDDVSLNTSKQAFSGSYAITTGKPSFVASFPTNHNEDWFAKLALLKARDGTEDKEVKWRWFQRNRDCFSRDIREGTYTGLGQAILFINDIAPYLDKYESIFLSIGVEKDALQAPRIKEKCLQLAAEDTVFSTPLYDLHDFNPEAVFGGYVPVERDDPLEFDPKDYVDRLKNKNGLSPQNVQLFAGEAQACFQEMLDPDARAQVAESLYEQRYVTYEQAKAKLTLLAASANRSIDGGNEKVTSVVKEVRDQAGTKIKAAIKTRYAVYSDEDYSGYGNTFTDSDSSKSVEIQKADLACGYAEELFRNYGGAIGKLTSHFRRVFYNNKLVKP